MNNRQLTVLTGNSAPHVGNVFSILSQAGVNIRAHCLVDNGEVNCKLRLIVSDPDKAVKVLEGHKFTTVVNDVVVVEIDDKPGGLSRILKLLEGQDIRITYTYTAASESPGAAVMVFRFSDNAQARRILEQNRVNLVKVDPKA
ncbi:MAG: hypothetical protein ACM3KE_14780 [Hyphomicrobiales bacterium]